MKRADKPASIPDERKAKRDYERGLSTADAFMAIFGFTRVDNDSPAARSRRGEDDGDDSDGDWDE
jgi:hypothetical protein